MLGDVFTNAYPAWTFGVQIGYPLGTSASEANLAKARLQYSQAETQLRNLELQIVTAVRDAARQVQTNRQRIDTSRAARELAERRLDAEEKKFAAGIQTSFFVFQAQRDLAQARTNEVRAISDYNKSLVDYEAVQEVPLTGIDHRARWPRPHPGPCPVPRHGVGACTMNGRAGLGGSGLGSAAESPRPSPESPSARAQPQPRAPSPLC